MKQLLILGALAALLGAGLGSGLPGVNSAAAETYVNAIEVRVIARPLEDGSVEFGIEHRGEQVLPQGRFLTPALIQQRQGEWLASTPVQVFGVPRVPAILGGTPAYLSDDNLWESDGFGKTAASLQVNVIALEDGRIEFAILYDGREYRPESRFITPDLFAGSIERWLRSSVVRLEIGETAAELARDFSTRIYATDQEGSPPIDIARECVLYSVTSPAASVSEGALQHVVRNEFQELYPKLAFPLRIDLGPYDVGGRVALYASNNYWNVHWNDDLADYYGMVVLQDNSSSPTWWVAEFDCRAFREVRSSSGGLEPTGLQAQ